MDVVQPSPAPTAPSAPSTSPASRSRGSDRSLAAVAAAQVGRLVLYVLLIALLVAVLYPLFWMVMTGFKTNQELFGNAWGLPGALRWENFADAWDQGVVRYLLNSFVVTAGSVLTTVGISSLAAYALTRMRLPFSTPLTLAILGGMMLSPTVALIPLFRLIQALGIFDTYWALIVLYTAFRIPFTVFLIRAYMITISREMEDAAIVDGAGRWGIFWHVILPLSRPIIISASLLHALFAWNEFMFALVFINNQDLKTLPVGLLDLQSRFLTDYPVMFAGLTIAAMPMIVVFVLGQRQFIRGLAEGYGK
ncbi:MAG TPA: carbohydrate ABC transporter permease [Candidatus Limnocylindrales bacterium]